MNFTADVKKEMISRIKAQFKRSKGVDKTLVDACKKAALSAFIRTSGALGFVGETPTFFIVSETENVAEFFAELFFDVFGSELTVSHAYMDRMSGRDKLVFQCPLALGADVVKELGLLRADGKEFKRGISSRFKKEEQVSLYFVIGAFLGGGSCTLPSDDFSKTGYHLEFVFADKKLAEEFCDLMGSVYLFAKVVERKETYVAYIKSKEVISDFLSSVGVENCLKKFSAIVQKRDEANRRNRSENCASGNADKTAVAAVRQVMAFQKLLSSPSTELPEDLQKTAKARLENPSMSMRELALLLGISKSCLNHRIRKLIELAEKI